MSSRRSFPLSPALSGSRLSYPFFTYRIGGARATLTARRWFMDLVRLVQNMVTDSVFASQMQHDTARMLNTACSALDDDVKEAILAICCGDGQWQRWCNPALKLSLLAWAPPAPAAPPQMHVLADTSKVDARYVDALHASLPKKHLPQSDSHQNPSLMSLPDLCCAAAGGVHEQAHAVGAAWQILYRALHILDAIEDDDRPDGAWAQWGMGPAVNITTGLLTSSHEALETLLDIGVSAQTARTIRSDFNQTILTMCAGQHHDLTMRQPTLDECWQIAEAKSGHFFALASRSGARLATDDQQVIESFGQFGFHLGVLIQIGDDLSGLWSTSESLSDLRDPDRWTLPVAYAMSTASPEDRKMLAASLQAAASDPVAEAQARGLIIKTGAVLYLMAEAQRHYQHARTILLQLASTTLACDALLSLLQSYLPGEMIGKASSSATPLMQIQPTLVQAA
ncbi:MAG TPA: polyprenyl synthetase family protein [Herpetosiphonaceae bacterium]